MCRSRIGVLVYFVTMSVMLISCKTETVRPFRYIKNEIKYSCEAQFSTNQIKRVVCFSPSGDTILVEHFEKDRLQGTSTLRHENGVIKEVGEYEKGFRSGVWKTYYADGILESYNYYNPDLDSSNLYYQKNYSVYGEVESFRYPLDIYRIPDSTFVLDSIYELIIELGYSEYDSVGTYGWLEKQQGLYIHEDTVSFVGNKLIFRVTPTKPGPIEIHGMFIELDLTKGFTDEAYGGDKEFTFMFEASE